MTKSCHFFGNRLNGTSVGTPNSPALAQQVVLALGAEAGLPGPHHALRQRAGAVGQRQVVINADDAAEAPAGRAGADRVVEAEQGGRRLAVFDVALGAVPPVAEELRGAGPGLGARRLPERVRGLPACLCRSGRLVRRPRRTARGWLSARLRRSWITVREARRDA